MSKLITTITHGQKYRVKIDVVHTTLSLEQIQILSGLVFAKYHSHEYYHPKNTIKYVLQGYTLTDEHDQEAFVWRDDVVTYNWLDDVDPDSDDVAEYTDDNTYEYHVTRTDGYTIVKCDDNHTTVTFKDGLLESIADEPAVKVDHFDGFTVRMWFLQNKCYRLDNPQLPSSIAYDWHTHHDSNGKLHRDVKLGPARYLIEGGVLQKGEDLYFLNGEECDEHGDVIEYSKRSSFVIPDYDIPWVGIVPSSESDTLVEFIDPAPFGSAGYGAHFLPLPTEDVSERLGLVEKMLAAVSTSQSAGDGPLKIADMV